MACAALECVTVGLAPGCLKHLPWAGGGEGSLSLPLCPPPSALLSVSEGETLLQPAASATSSQPLLCPVAVVLSPIFKKPSLLGGGSGLASLLRRNS